MLMFLPKQTKLSCTQLVAPCTNGTGTSTKRLLSPPCRLPHEQESEPPLADLDAPDGRLPPTRQALSVLVTLLNSILDTAPVAIPEALHVLGVGWGLGALAAVAALSISSLRVLIRCVCRGWRMQVFPC